MRRSAPSRVEGSPEFMWYVYILLCRDGSFYTGCTDNPERRYSEHKDGRGGHYTSGHKPVKLLYIEQWPSKSEALKREAQIKGWSHLKKIKILKLKF